MRRIDSFALWLGNVADLENPAVLYDAEIRAIVDLAVNEPFPHLPRDLIYCRVPLIDGSCNESALIRLAVRTVAHLLVAAIPTIVCCSNGLSRSPAIAAGAIHLVLGTPLNESLQLVTKVGHDVSPALWRDVELNSSP